MTKISPGDRFGHWTVLAPSKERPYYFTCRCDCGTVKDVYRSSLLQGGLPQVRQTHRHSPQQNPAVLAHPTVRRLQP